VNDMAKKDKRVYFIVVLVLVLGVLLFLDKGFTGKYFESGDRGYVGETWYVPCDKEGAYDLAALFKELYSGANYCSQVAYSPSDKLPMNNVVVLDCETQAHKNAFVKFCNDAVS